MNPFGFALTAPSAPRRAPQDMPSAPFGFQPPPSKMQQTLAILNEYNPLPAFGRLLNSPMALGGPITEGDIADGLTVAGGVTGGSALAPKPKNALNMGIRAFHGSPHDFDEFSMSKIGTGEGAQAYGHGLYFADSEGIAQHYRDTLAKPQMTLDGQPFTTTGNRSVDKLIAKHNGDLDAVTSELGRNIEKYGNDADAEALGVAESLLGRFDVSEPSGRMYEVNINADPDTFLDWDKPLSEQPEAVRKALGLDQLPGPPTDEEVQAVFALANQRGVDAFEMPEYKALEARLDSYKADAWNQMGIAPPYRGDVHVRADAITGGEYVHGLEKGELGPMALTGATPTASRMLKEKGIPGIKYLDAGSRGAGDGTRNYVVFDDRLISVVRKYGIAGASAMLGYNILDGMDPAQAAELKQIEGNQ